MQKLLDFLYRWREVGVFVFLEILSIWLLFSFNQRQGAAYFNSSNYLAGSISQSSENVSNYFELTEINQRLMLENELLQARLNALEASPSTFLDTIGRYQVIGARVVANTTGRGANFITLAAGKRDSVQAGMGVITSLGIAGQVKSVSQNFATVYSVLHPNLLISAKVKRTQTMATVQWDQKDYSQASLKYVPRHIKLSEGDTVITSGFNSVFPEGLPIGIVQRTFLEDQMTFYEADIRLLTDFTSLNYVYVIKDLLKQEKDSLEAL
ncbi:MAG: rod shape-determining protein MreC [Bacteroidota bacterium]